MREPSDFEAHTIGSFLDRKQMLLLLENIHVQSFELISLFRETQSGKIYNSSQNQQKTHYVF